MYKRCTSAAGDGGFNVNTEPISLDEREVICRLRNCVRCLAKHSVMLYDTSVLYAYESSLQYQVGDFFLSSQNGKKVQVFYSSVSCCRSRTCSRMTCAVKLLIKLCHC